MNLVRLQTSRVVLTASQCLVPLRLSNSDLNSTAKVSTVWSVATLQALPVGILLLLMTRHLCSISDYGYKLSVMIFLIASDE